MTHEMGTGSGGVAASKDIGFGVMTISIFSFLPLIRIPLEPISYTTPLIDLLTEAF